MIKIFSNKNESLVFFETFLIWINVDTGFLQNIDIAN